MHEFDQPIADLQKIYQTAGPYYLSNFYQPNGEKNLYEFLISVYQTEYQNNFRILIVQDCPDVYDYEDLPGKTICKLQQFASEIDISNFFILVITGNTDINSELEQCRKLYSKDTCNIQSHVVNHIVYSKTYKTQDTFCVLPWIHLYVGTDGNVLPCCQADHQHPMGTVGGESINDILQSSRFNQLRRNMLSGRRSKECSRCYAQEDLNTPSSRILHNARWPEIKSTNVDPSGIISEFTPRYLDLRLNNICNLKCRMCSGYFSSAIAQEEVVVFGNKKTTMPKNLRVNALTEILNYLPQCEKIYFAGGEPLITSEHYDILDALISCGNTDLEIVYNTNFTTLQYQNRNVLDFWQKFSNVKVNASIDAQGEAAEYVRHGTAWTNIECNLSLIKSQCPHVNFSISSTVGLLNVSSLIALQKDWHTSEKLHISKFSQSPLISPLHLAVSSLPDNHKHRLTTFINEHIDWCQKNQAYSLANQWNNVLTYMWSKDTSYAMAEFKRLTKIMDEHRHESLVDVLPEYTDLLLDIKILKEIT